VVISSAINKTNLFHGAQIAPEASFPIASQNFFPVFWQMEVNYWGSTLKFLREMNPAQSTLPPAEGGPIDSSKQSINFYQYMYMLSDCKKWLIFKHRFNGFKLRVVNPVSQTHFRVEANDYFIFFFHWHYSPLWALACRTISFHFSLSTTNSFHLLTPTT